jgi:hypothetical protein
MTEEIKLNQYLDSLWRAKWLIVLAAIVAGIAVGYYRYRQPPTFTAEGLLQVGRVWKEPIEDPYLTTEIINSGSFSRELAPRLGVPPGLLRRSLKAAIVTAGPQRTGYPILVTITASGGTSGEAIRMARTAADEVIARHELTYNQSVGPHLDYQKQLEAALGPTGVLTISHGAGEPGKANADAEAARPSVPAGAAPQISDALAKILHDYDEVKSFNESTAITQRSRLLGDVVATGSTRPSIATPAVIAAVLAALIAGTAAMLLGLLQSTPTSQQTRPTLSSQQDVPDASIG